MPDLLFDPQLIHVAGWTLVHFLWQASLIGLGVGLAKRLLPDHEASWRYGVSCVGLAAMSLAAVITVLALTFSERAIAPFSISVTWIESQLPLIYIAWVMGVVGLSFKLAGGWLLIHRLKRLSEPVHKGLQDRVDELRYRIGVSRPVSVFRSALVRVPMVVGWFKPVILIPGSLVTGIPAAELEALLSHELGHIRRYDYLVNGLQTFVETVFFFHPAVWWVSRQIRVEREHCCDDLVLNSADKVIYTRALLELEEVKGAGLTFSFSGAYLRADGGHLVTRIRRLVTAPESNGSNASKLICAFSMVAVVLGSVQLSDAGYSTMLSLQPEVLPLEASVRSFQGPFENPVTVDLVTAHAVILSNPMTSDPQVAAVIPAQIERQVSGEPIISADPRERERQEMEPARPVARTTREGVWNAQSLSAFIAESQGHRPSISGRPSNRLGLGLSGGVIQSSTIGPLSPNIEIRGLWALDYLTQIEVGIGFSMFFHENLYAFTDTDGAQVQVITNYEQQLQFSLGIRRAFEDDRLTGFYYGLAGGVKRLPINRLIGDADKPQDAYDSKIGYFFLPRIGYIARVNAPFSWDLSAGLSFSRANGIEFVQPVVSLGLNYWK